MVFTAFQLSFLLFNFAFAHEVLNEEPLVSVIMTSYNRHEYFENAIKSIMVQTYKNWELIIVDDGSHEEQTIQILDKYLDGKVDARIKVHKLH